MIAIFESFLLAQAQMANGRWDWFSELNAGNKFALIIVGISCATGVICTAVVFISGTINSIHRRRVATDLKREMIERGMTADEIVRIIEAAPPPDDVEQAWIAAQSKPKRQLASH
jgi:hypothetical protein